jgi:hypothetical protein
MKTLILSTFRISGNNLFSLMSKYIQQLWQLSNFANQDIGLRSSFSLSTFRLLTLGLFLSLSISTIQCGLDVEDPNIPLPPHWVEKSFPEEWPERGIDAHESNSIYLEWEQYPDFDIITYFIYRATYFARNDSLGEFELIFRFEANFESTLEYIDVDASIGVTYHYKIAAENISGVKSALSNSAVYSILPPLDINRMTPNGISDTLYTSRVLHWSYDYHIEMENYCITILTNTNQIVWRSLINPVNYTSNSESVCIPDTISLESNWIYRWRIDIGANYEKGIETSGAESPWATFLFLSE